MPLSCDEAFLEVTGLGDPAQLAAAIRADVAAATGCTASAGVGPNQLVARIATERGKPNGQFCVGAEGAAAFLADLPAGKLPGVGPSTEHKLAEAGVLTVRDVQVGHMHGCWCMSQSSVVHSAGAVVFIAHSTAAVVCSSQHCRRCA